MRAEIKWEIFQGILAIWLTAAIGSLTEVHLGATNSRLLMFSAAMLGYLILFWLSRRIPSE